MALTGLLACNSDVRDTSDAGTTGASTTTGDATSTSGTGSTSNDATSGTGTSGSSGSTGGEPEVACDQLDISLVIDPDAPAFDPAARQALGDTLATLVETTGAEVRLFVNTGTEVGLITGCTLGLNEAGDGQVLIYGREFQVLAEAPAALTCLLDAIEGYSGVEDEGDYLFSGLMFPILEQPNWPTPGAVGLSILIGATDDELSNMYSRPGMTSEAYLRIVADGDRRRAATLTVGKDADELELFAITMGDTSLYADLAETTVPQALQAWTPMAVKTCQDHDLIPPPEDTDGCKHIDVLFVIDGSFSMLEEQLALRGIQGPPVFKDFTDALVEKLVNLEDFRVGVVSSQPGDTALHTHMDQPEVAPAPETDCGLTAAQPFLIGPSPTFEADFACVASTKANADEFTALNAAEALHDPANAGFLRDDSVVVVVMLTDEDTQEWFTGHTRVEVHERLMDAVGGDRSRLFVLGIAGDQGVFEMPKSVCNGEYGGAAPGRRLTSIVYSFRDKGVVQDICGGSLADVFNDVLDDVAKTCEEFVPPG